MEWKNCCLTDLSLSLTFNEFRVTRLPFTKEPEKILKKLEKRNRRAPIFQFIC